MNYNPSQGGERENNQLKEQLKTCQSELKLLKLTVKLLAEKYNEDIDL